MNALEYITRSLRLINVLASGEQPEASEAADALVTLNTMMDAFTADRLMIYTVNRSGPFNLTPGQQTYTLGPGGGPFNLSAVRPPRITQMGVIVLTNPLQPLELPVEMLTDEEWAAIPVKNIQSSIPLRCWDDGGFPQRTLSFWCIPNTLVQIVPYVWQKLTQFADLTTDYTFPEAYQETIAFNLAVRLAPEFGVESINPLVVNQALLTKGAIKRMNSPIIEMRCDPAVTGQGGIYDWRSDTFVKTGNNS